MQVWNPNVKTWANNTATQSSKQETGLFFNMLSICFYFSKFKLSESRWKDRYWVFSGWGAAAGAVKEQYHGLIPVKRDKNLFRSCLEGSWVLPTFQLNSSALTFAWESQEGFESQLEVLNK